MALATLVTILAVFSHRSLPRVQPGKILIEDTQQAIWLARYSAENVPVVEVPRPQPRRSKAAAIAATQLGMLLRSRSEAALWKWRASRAAMQARWGGFCFIVWASLI